VGGDPRWGGCVIEGGGHASALRMHTASRARPRAQVVVVDKMDYCASLNNLNPCVAKPNFKCVKGDVQVRAGGRTCLLPSPAVCAARPLGPIHVHCMHAHQQQQQQLARKLAWSACKRAPDSQLTHTRTRSPWT